MPVAQAPFKLNSRTFIRNVKPLYYPEGTRIGSDWEAPGGMFDNTDARNPIYWGPPRPINDDPDFNLQAGETPANAVRRLKIDGYVGLYCARIEEERRKMEAPPPEAPRTSRLEQIADAASLMRRNRRRSIVVSEDGAFSSRRATRTEQRNEQRDRNRDALNRNRNEEADDLDETSEPPLLIGVGMGVENSEVQFQAEETDAEQRETILRSVGIPPGPGAASAKAATQSAEPESSDNDETDDEDAPVGGGGQAVAVPAVPAVPLVPPVSNVVTNVTKPPTPTTPRKRGGTGAGLAGGGARRSKQPAPKVATKPATDPAG